MSRSRPPLSLRRHCFLVAKNDEQDTLVTLFKPVLGPFGYEIARSEHVDDDSAFRPDVVRFLLDAELTIFDITDPRPDICVDIGLRYASGRPMLTVTRDETTVPSSLKHLRPVVYYPADAPRNNTETWDKLRTRLSGIDSGRRDAERPIFAMAGQQILIGGVPLTIEQVRLLEEAQKRRGTPSQNGSPANGKMSGAVSRFFVSA